MLYTLLKTIGVVVMTCLFASSVRFVRPISDAVNALAGVGARWGVYDALGLDTPERQEWLVFMFILVASFFLSLVVMFLLENIFRKRNIMT